MKRVILWIAFAIGYVGIIVGLGLLTHVHPIMRYVSAVLFLVFQISFFTAIAPKYASFVDKIAETPKEKKRPV